jgi:AraC-like DNA-binding protein
VVRAAGRDLAIIPPGNDYNVRVQTAVSHLYIHFVGRVPGLRETAPVTTIRLPDYGAKLVAQIVDLRRSSPNDRLGAHLMSHSLVSLALSVCPGELFLSNTLDPSIDRAIAFMDEHLREPIVNASIASAVNLSTSTFIRRFRAQTGYSPHAYLMRLRAARAAALLMDRRVGLDEVAESAGLADRAHLFRVFAREYGIGPTGFRRLQRQYPPDGDTGDGRISDI